jgi:hypothetical protein
MDNIFVERLWRSLKYEEVYLNAYATVAEAKAGIWRLARLLQHGAPAPEPRLSHAAANLPGRPVDMWTIGVADRLRFPHFPSELGKRGNARLRPHAHRRHSQQAIRN